MDLALTFDLGERAYSEDVIVKFPNTKHFGSIMLSIIGTRSTQKKIQVLCLKFPCMIIN